RLAGGRWCGRRGGRLLGGERTGHRGGCAGQDDQAQGAQAKAHGTLRKLGLRTTLTTKGSAIGLHRPARAKQALPPRRRRDDGGLRHFFVSTVSTVGPAVSTASRRSVPALGALTLVDALSISDRDGGRQGPPKSL